jgi:hypothetical protein
MSDNSTCKVAPCVWITANLAVGEHVDTVGVHVHGSEGDSILDVLESSVQAIRLATRR